MQHQSSICRLFFIETDVVLVSVLSPRLVAAPLLAHSTAGSHRWASASPRLATSMGCCESPLETHTSLWKWLRAAAHRRAQSIRYMEEQRRRRRLSILLRLCYLCCRFELPQTRTLTLTRSRWLWRLSQVLWLPPLWYRNVSARRRAFTLYHHIHAETMYVAQRNHGRCDDGKGKLLRKSFLQYLALCGRL